MNSQRLTLALLVIGGGFLALMLVARAQQPPAKKEAPARVDRAAETGGDAPAPASRPAPAATEAPSPQAPAVRAATQPTAPAAKIAPPPPRRSPEFRARLHPAQQPTLGAVDPKKEFAFEIQFDAAGAAVRAVRLAEHYATVEDKLLAQRFPDDHARYQAQRDAKPDRYKGHYRLLAPVEYRGTRYLSFATERIYFTLPGRKQPTSWALADRNWRLLPSPQPAADDTWTVRFAYALERDQHFGQGDAGWPDFRPFLTLFKTYTVRKRDYSIDMLLTVKNHTGGDVSVAVDQHGPLGVAKEDLRSDRREVPVGKRQKDGDGVKVLLDLKQASLPKMPYGRGPEENVGMSDAGDSTLWIGYTNKFFGSMMCLQPDPNAVPSREDCRARFYAYAVQESDEHRTFVTGVKLGAGAASEEFIDGRPVIRPALKIPGGKDLSVRFDLFAGPKERALFVDADDPAFHALYKQMNYVSTIDLGGCFCSSSWLALGMMWLLQKLSIVAFGNYGVAIILLVILVRVALHPLTKKGQVSMMKMQKLTPMIQKIKEKYADDKEAQQRETLKIYKEHGAGGMLGCLPMLLQMPIWIALFTGLNALIDLRHAPFLPVWITDLAGPDALIRWAPIRIPLLSGIWGDVSSFNLLPILLCAAFFLQTKYNPSMSGQPAAAATPEQQAQKKMMQYMMPGMMLLFFYQAPAGLTLYIMTSTSVGLIEQYVIRKHIREKEALEAATETTVQAPGKRSRSSRPKKPKGPFWVKNG